MMRRDDFLPGLAVVSGAAQGIGAAVTLALARARVPVAALDIQPLQHLAAEGDAAGLPLQTHVVDVADGEAVRAVVDRIEALSGPIGMLVNVAGVLHLGDALELSDADWLHCFAVNTHGVFHLSRAVAARMRARGTGSLVTVGSNAAAVPRTQMAAYAASKAAAHQFTRCLGLELAGQGIRCNIVAPGSTDTPMQRQLWTDAQARERILRGSLESFRTGIPLGRIAAPADVAEAVLFLLSNAARHVTLHTLSVDGGATLGI
ncbi:2,3-dihydro-2,3-dihydroxybenzoate dehydrogenase [Verminephrobacter aporrectodeae subsp. tuberculatae]|uniref:2,3-dihydro-2,3-dihydroxybenzoate dehydrogenase n=1 Tax=Verminephrobacter aporrectodeae TaxID=1110389 RepID=UPI0022373984|nr:2,3-dihydro-2,3-dihydroxybenzoate dehydrogenase [Verminephrobacter aporrectodeae]MCW5256029.1 2,3-dihydro-2,3-dihydroxybenzoate dehydrogenase [Verminephrobacter aporrectodeae subsp. tuberculatae]